MVDVRLHVHRRLLRLPLHLLLEIVELHLDIRRAPLHAVRKLVCPDLHCVHPAPGLLILHPHCRNFQLHRLDSSNRPIQAITDD